MSKMKSTKSVLCLLLSVFFYPGCMNKNLSYSDKQLQSLVEEYLTDKKDILGTVIKVDVEGQQSFTAASGYFDLSRKNPIQPTDKLIIGSITKVFTAVLVHQLAEQGKVELQRPLIDYLPSDWSAVLAKIKYGSEITVEHALCHRSGLADVTETHEFRKMLQDAPSKPWSAIEILKLTHQQGEPKFKPGKGYDYCNTNTLLLGALIEQVTRQPYRVSLKRNILERMDMKNTFLSEGTFGSGKDGIAHGYFFVGDKVYDGQEVSVGWAQASGGIISTANDLIMFFKALVSHELFEKKESFEQMVRIVGGNEQYGLGMMVFDDPEIGIHYGHGGSFCGTRTLLAYFPKHKTTAFICHTYCANTEDPGIEKLMKLVIKDIFHDESEVPDQSKTDVHDILADTLKIYENPDNPTLGNWDFDVQDLWSINNINSQTIKKRFLFHVGEDGEIYLMDPASGKIFVLDSNGNLLSTFGEEEELTGYPAGMFITSDYIYVFEVGNTVNRIKTFDKKGSLINSFKIFQDISPRVFVNGEKLVAIRSGTDIDKKQTYETLELLEEGKSKGTIIGKFQAEEKLIVSMTVNMGRTHILLDDIELFPKLIVHTDKDMLYLGRSDRYMVKKCNLQGNEILAFTVKGRNRKTVPTHIKENLVAGIGPIGGKAMPKEISKEIFAGIPEQQVFFTHITTDEQGLIYVFVPDIINTGRQEIDIFSPDGHYLYQGVIELTEGLEKVRPLIIEGEYLYTLAHDDKQDIRLIKYRIKLPKLSGEKSQ